MKKSGLVFLAVLSLVVGGVSYSLGEDTDTAGFVQSIEYGNFTVGLVILDLSRVPEEITDSLTELGLEKNVAFVIVKPTAWATDSAEDHSWLIVDGDGSEYSSLDPFLQDDLAKKVEALDDRIKRFIYRSSPRHSFAPDRANPLLVFFSGELPPIDSWERVVFRDFLNGFQVDMHKVNKDGLDFQVEEGFELL